MNLERRGRLVVIGMLLVGLAALALWLRSCL